MNLPKLDLEFLRTVPILHKIFFLFVLVFVVVYIVFWNNYLYLPLESWVEKENRIALLQAENQKLDQNIQTLTVKVKHLDELIAAHQQLEIELSKKKEMLPPEEEAVMLLKQIAELGSQLGLEIKLWRPGTRAEDPSKLFVRLPFNVELAGGYHTAALFFDRIHNLPRIVNVSGLRMGNPKVEEGRAVIQLTFDLTAFVAPPETKPGTPPPAAGAKK